MWVEVQPGEVIQVAEWMLDRAFCADMEMGEPQVSVAGLIELNRLLTERGFRHTSTDGLTAIQEARHEGITTTGDITNADPATVHTIRYTADDGPDLRKERPSMHIQRVKLPRRRRPVSYSAQFVTLNFILPI